MVHARGVDSLCCAAVFAEVAKKGRRERRDKQNQKSCSAFFAAFLLRPLRLEAFFPRSRRIDTIVGILISVALKATGAPCPSRRNLFFILAGSILSLAHDMSG